MAETKNTTITLDELKSFLWGAAVRLRGQIDAAGYKEYIFPLLFFKRISDVYDEQYNKYFEEGGKKYADMQAEDFAIRIPEGAHWNDVRQVTENVGQQLVDAFRDIEQANPGVQADGRIIGGLEGIFGPKDIWTNKAKMPDHIITSLIEDFSRYTLSLATCPADEMGQAYEYLVGKFADDAGNTAQEFYTNRTVVDLMSEILQPRPGESIYDPTCGSGGMLVKCLDYLRKKGEPWQGVKVFGQEINAITSSIARMNLYLNGVEEFSVAREDTLAHPAFVDGSQLRKFDIVLANPPYSIKTWNREAFAHDRWGRNFLGTPIQARADYAFIQHILASMKKDTGRCAILLPHGVLNRDEDKEIRINHVKTDCIDTIIGLGRNLFFNSGLESFIFICSNNKATKKKGKVLFIEAEKCTHKEGKQAYLFPEDIRRIMSAYNSDEDIPGFSKYVTIEEILANDGNLNIKSYVKSIDESVLEDDEHILSDFDISRENVSKALSDLMFVEDQYSVDKLVGTLLNGYDRSGWGKVKLGEVASEYSKRIDNPSMSEFDYYIGSDCIGQYDFRIHKKSPAKCITSAQKLFCSGDYLLVRRSLYGSDFRERAPRADFDGVCSADILTIRENKDKIENGFLIYVLYSRALWDFIVSNSNGGLTRRIKWKQLETFEFYLPPKEIQKEIADKLWAAYELKEAYKKMIAATDEMVKSQFIEMFEGDKYPSVKLSDIASEWLKGQSFRKDDIVDNGNSMCIHYGELFTKYGPIINQVLSRTNVEGKRTSKVGDILFPASDVTPNGLARCSMLPYDNIILGGDIIVLRPKRDCNAAYLSYAINQQTAQLLIRVNGAVVKHMSAKALMTVVIPMPPLEEQNRFVSLAQQADKSKFELQQAIDKIDKVMKSLLQ